MLIDLEEFRPQNETWEHFFLKQVGRAYLFNQGIRCVGTEVEVFDNNGVGGQDHPPFGEHKRIIDVLGVDRRRVNDDVANKLFWKIDDLAIELAINADNQDLVEKNYKNENQWKSEHEIKDDVERKALLESINLFRSEAATNLGYKSDAHKNLRWRHKEKWSLRGIEVKASYSDFKNGFSMTAEHSYVLAPVGIVPKNELPQKVGLLEFDFDKYTETNKWQDALIVTKKSRKEYDSAFYEGEKKKSKLNHERHQQFCRDMLFKIAQQNTEESIFWNPHMVQMENGYTSPRTEEKYLYRIGDETPNGVVVERRMGRNPDKSDYYHREIPYYKFVVVGKGLTKWTSQTEMEGELWRKTNGNSLLLTKRS